MDQQTQMARIIAKAWADDGFKSRLIADPAAVLGEEGIHLPEGMTMRVMEDTPETTTLVIPPKPSDGEISEENLSSVTGGMCCTSWSFP